MPQNNFIVGNSIELGRIMFDIMLTVLYVWQSLEVLFVIPSRLTKTSEKKYLKTYCQSNCWLKLFILSSHLIKCAVTIRLGKVRLCLIKCAATIRIIYRHIKDTVWNCNVPGHLRVIYSFIYSNGHSILQKKLNDTYYLINLCKILSHPSFCSSRELTNTHLG